MLFLCQKRQSSLLTVFFGRIGCSGLAFFLTVSGFQTARPPSDVCCRSASAWNGFNHLPGTQIPSGCFPSAPVIKCSKHRPTPKEIPRRRPPGIPYLQYRMQNSGACAGERSRGWEAWREGPPPQGGPSLQGLPHLRELTSSAGIQSRRRSGRTGRRRR